MPGAYQNTLDKIKSINIDYKGSQEQSTTRGNPSFITDNLAKLLELGDGPQGAHGGSGGTPYEQAQRHLDNWRRGLHQGAGMVPVPGAQAGIGGRRYWGTDPMGMIIEGSHRGGTGHSGAGSRMRPWAWVANGNGTLSYLGSHPGRAGDAF